jgi:hypothetical protein
MKFSHLSTQLATLAFTILALSGQAPSPQPAMALPLPDGNGAWVAQVVVSGGALYKATSYYLNSNGKGRIQFVMAGATNQPAEWTIAPADLARVGASINVAKPKGWANLPHRCCNGTYFDLKVVARNAHGHVWHHTAGWNASTSFQEPNDALSIAANIRLAFARAQGR